MHRRIRRDWAQIQEDMENGGEGFLIRQHILVELSMD
jgi:hypothetical protein